MTPQQIAFVASFVYMQDCVYQNARDKGWWEEDRNDGEMIALMHSELSEALEALRKGNPIDSHCPDFRNVAVEMADTVIRIMDFCAARNLPLADAIIAKHEYNKLRSHKHGGKKF